MKNKKIILFITGILFILFGFFVFTSFVSADQFGLDITKQSSGVKTTSDINSIEGITARILSTMLTFLSVIFFLLVVYGGGRWMLARGNSDEIKKAQDTIIMAIIGVIIILGANALVNFVFQSVGTGIPQESSSQTCDEAHPGWQVLKNTECAGKNYSKNITYPGNQCYFLEEYGSGKENNCDIKTVDSVLKDDLVCCLPYISKCARSYPGYECVDDPLNCDVGTEKKQIGLCDSVNDWGEICCQSSEVWCLYGEYDDPTDLETLKSFECKIKKGQCSDSSKSFSSVESCRSLGENKVKLYLESLK